MRKRKTDQYAYEEIYDTEVLGEENIIDALERMRFYKYKYLVKTIISGDYLESEIYPIYIHTRDAPRKDKEKNSREAQTNLNDKNARKRFVRLVNTNFSKNDLAVDLTYADNFLPTEEEARRDIQNYIRRIKNYRKKHRLEPLKYIYVIEFLGEDERGKTKKVRIHHHMIINQMDRNVVEDLWGKGRVSAERLQPDEFGLEGKARYIIKNFNKGTKRWSGSRNLKQPEVHRSTSKLTKRKAEKLAKNENDASEIIEKMYKGKYILNDVKTYINPDYGGCYIYARMRRRE